MRLVPSWLTDQWTSYRHRFLPWVALNLGQKAVRIRNGQDGEAGQGELVVQLQEVLAGLQQYSGLREELGLYEQLHHINQVWRSWAFRGLEECLPHS